MPYEYEDRDAGRRALTGVLALLTDPAPWVREHGAAEVGGCFRRRAGDQDDTEAAVARLVTLMVAETDERVRSSALGACADAATAYRLPLALFEPLIPLLPNLSAELSEYVLLILGLVRDPAARPVITPYLDHPEASVRLEATDALARLTGQDEVSP
ncbi:HEAT repeat domain-containing protein [Micromonospora purpureochromogenes]|uniref:HEAT repeat domain-containing protein n=1 Tax=Micromonospora purpureochromogenes TaxID=47872 RepID=UPI0033C3D314